jgi:hypothetical protein
MYHPLNLHREDEQSQVKKFKPLADELFKILHNWTSSGEHMKYGTGNPQVVLR